MKYFGVLEISVETCHWHVCTMGGYVPLARLYERGWDVAEYFMQAGKYERRQLIHSARMVS
jgi:hypothetical protein